MIFSDSAIQNRKARTATALSNHLAAQDAVLVFAGEPIQKPGGHDQTYNYIPHPDYFWLTGYRRPSGISVFSKDTGWTDFVMPVSTEEKIWEGGGHPVAGEDLSRLEEWLTSKKFGRLIAIGRPVDRTHLQKINLVEDHQMQEVFSDVRRVKDAEEIQLVRTLAGHAHKGYQLLKKIIRPGISERAIQIEYEAEVLRAGAETMPYGTIVGTGTNSAILHASPSDRIVKDGEHVLVDAGADLYHYCVDITRNFAANGKFSSQQQALYDVVKQGQLSAIEQCKPGVEWHQVHRTAGVTMAKGLRELGLLKISGEEAFDSGAIGVFFPHGVGHMVGLQVRDVGGKPNPNPKRYGGARLRVDMPLREGFLMTVEPGLYFIEALIESADLQKQFADQIAWTEVSKWKNFGGIRLEDDIWITANGPQNLTSAVEK
jgi:Xaa-Pro dipeptidase